MYCKCFTRLIDYFITAQVHLVVDRGANSARTLMAKGQIENNLSFKSNPLAAMET